MHEAYMYGYWDEVISFIRSMFNVAFKANPYLKRAIMTGITRGSKESIFSDLNNLKVVVIISEGYDMLIALDLQNEKFLRIGRV